ncbi:hypothetical protein H4R24_005569 [Coemansia sp. RSA 988]|nr:hypothetical protein H4R24_005569 [Coemansia sp. RSA 988]
MGDQSSNVPGKVPDVVEGSSKVVESSAPRIVSLVVDVVMQDLYDLFSILYEYEQPDPAKSTDLIAAFEKDLPFFSGDLDIDEMSSFSWVKKIMVWKCGMLAKVMEGLLIIAIKGKFTGRVKDALCND